MDCVVLEWVNLNSYLSRVLTVYNILIVWSFKVMPGTENTECLRDFW